MGSRVLGLVRDAAMAAQFGNGPLLDAFTLAFRIPNLARALLGEGALATAFLPAYIAERETNGHDAARRLAFAVVTSLAATLLLLIGCAELVLFCWPSLGRGSFEADLLRRLMIWLTPYVGLVCLTAQLGAQLNAEREFLIPALLPVVFNAVWLCGLWLVVPFWNEPVQQLFAMSGCILVGGAVQLAIPLTVLWRQGFHMDPGWRRAWPRMVTIAAHMAPILGGQLVIQINTLMDSVIAWSFSAPADATAATLAAYPLTAGTTTALYLSQRLYQFPLGVFGVALGTVVFAQLAEHAQARRWPDLHADLSLGLRYVAAIAIPASAGLMLLGEPIAVLCFRHGEFDAAAAAQTGRMIMAYGSGVWAYCGLLLLNRAFFALGDRQTPLRMGMAAGVLNIALNLLLIWPLGGIGLAASTALVAMLQCAVAVALLKQRLGAWALSHVHIAAGKALLATVAMMLAGWQTLHLLPPGGTPANASRLLAPLAVALATYFLMCRALRFHEPYELVWRRGRKNASPSARE